MIYIEKSTKSVETLVKTFEEKISDFKFGILHIHNVNETLNSKGVEFNKQCQILDICNPNHAKEFLSNDMTMSVVMPCRITVYEDKGESFIAMNSLVQLIDDINPDLIEKAQEIQDTLLELIDNVK